MGGIRERLYDAAEKFDKFLGRALKRVPPSARAVIVLLIAGLAGAAAWKGRTHLAYLLLACGIFISLGALTAKGRGKHKK
jgi:hypothetical protein